MLIDKRNKCLHLPWTFLRARSGVVSEAEQHESVGGRRRRCVTGTKALRTGRVRRCRGGDTDHSRFQWVKF